MKFSEKILKVKVLNSRWDANYIIEIRWGSYSLQNLKGFSIIWECQSDIKIFISFTPTDLSFGSEVEIFLYSHSVLTFGSE